MKLPCAFSRTAFSPFPPLPRCGRGKTSPGILIVGLLLATRALAGTRPQTPPSTPTFTRDIAPILFKHCAACHRPGESAPFSLLTYQDARRRAQQIALVTQSRFMPPWKPEPGSAEFAHSRRLTDAQVTLFKRWVDTGAAEGHPADLPKPPTFPTGWRLGTPDLVLEMPKPYLFPAESLENYRSFVIPVPLTEDRWIRAVEIQPGNTKVARYATLFVDEAGVGRREEAASGTVGYTDFAAGIGERSPGSLSDWSPDVSPLTLPSGVAKPLKKGSDLVLMLQFHPDGEAETVQARIGLYFAKEPPHRQPVTLRLGAVKFGLRGGLKATITDSITLPTAVQVLSLTPRSHFIGKELKATATLPDGPTKSLLLIRDWDANWKEPYRFAAPLTLPAGTRVAIEYTFDNSAENPRNPHTPPHLIMPGLTFMEEMATLWLEVVPAREEDGDVLAQFAKSPGNHVQIVQSGKPIR